VSAHERGCERQRATRDRGASAFFVTLFIGSILEFLERQVAKLWLLDDVIFVDALPVGATGEVQKSELRERYAGWRGHAHA
jgi:acyl-CoA synthetase (AMP-forming)/AMP-acid ligase II